MLTTTAFVAALLEGASKTTTTKASTGSSIGSLLFIVVIFGLAYVFFLRPRSQAARRQRETLMELTAGDEVLTAAGIYGTVLDVADDRITLETAPGTRITVVRSTIARRIIPTDASSVAEQNWQDEGHDGVAEAAGWHDSGEEGHDHSSDPSGPSENGSTGDTEKPEADGAPGTTQEGGR